MATLCLMQTTIAQLANQAATVAVMAIKEADTGPAMGVSVANSGEAHKT